ncbi:MAG: SPOR domain-containing protein, partial [Deltaproteobacteria bacterium]
SAGTKLLIAILFVLMFVIFLIGLQIGRIVEKGLEEAPPARVVAKPDIPSSFDEEIAKKIEGFAGEEKPPGGEQGAPPGKEEERETAPPARAEKTLPSEKPLPAVKQEKPAREKSRVNVRTGYFLQVGVFSVEKNAESLRERAAGKGFPVVLERFRGKRGRLLTRVMIGPYASRDEALRHRGEVSRKLGVAKPLLVVRK